MAPSKSFLAVLAIASTATAQSESTANMEIVYANNIQYATYAIAALAALALFVALCQISIWASGYLRTISCLNNSNQRFFRIPSAASGLIKKHLLDAPLFRTRHHRELRLFHAWGMGFVPTRVQSLILTGIIAMNIVFCVYDIEWNDARSVDTMKHLRNRTGSLAVVNMIPLVILAGRNNPLIPILSLSYDTFNMFHRWIGRIIFVEALAHLGSYIAATYFEKDWAFVAEQMRTVPVVITGLLVLSAMLVINIQALSFIRHAFYEFFLHCHIFLAIVSIVGLWYHIPSDAPQMNFLYAIIASWAIERFIRVARLLYRNVGGRGNTRAIVEVLPGNALRVTFKLARPWTFKPGQYFFVTMPIVGLWTSHPFSAAWSDEVTTPTTKDKEMDSRSSLESLEQQTSTTVSAIIRARSGFTQKLIQKTIAAASKGPITVTAALEGPYGLAKSFSSYGTVVLFAGGVGITHQIPYLRSLLTGFTDGTVAARRVSLIWVVQSPEHLEWIRPWLMEILALDRLRKILRIQIFVTQPRNAGELQSPAAAIQMITGRPNIDTLVESEVSSRIGAMGVCVCGPGGLADDVRRAVRQRHTAANVEFVEESFAW